MANVHRVFNFSAGPSVLPVPVLEQMQRDLVALPGVGMSVLEISHRSETFAAMIEECESNIRALARLPEHYHVLFLPGGATLQFWTVPMSLLAAGEAADYIITGAWSEKAAKEAAKAGTVHVAYSGKDSHYTRIPTREEISLHRDAAYVHITGNETIHGVEFQRLPETGGVPIVIDGSSHIFSRPVELGDCALIYAGAQKNLGPAGCTLVLVREDMLRKAESNPQYFKIPLPLQYGIQAVERSLTTTPPVFAIYAMNLVTRWLRRLGGLEAVERINIRKSAKLYAVIDRSGFYRGHAERSARSRMNVVFGLPSPRLEARFLEQAQSAGLCNLKGHRSLGKVRASIYNAFPEEGVDALVAFMEDFERRNG